MKQSLFDQPHPEITTDLAKKLGIDIIDAISRTLELAPPGHLPILVAACVSSVGCLAKHLEQRVGIEESELLDKSVFVAALLVARMMKHQDFLMAMKQAMIDVDVLIDTGRL